MKNLVLPSNCAIIGQFEQEQFCGGCGFLSDSIYAAAKFIFPEKKIAGESRGGYYPTFILVPEALFLDYAALRAANLLYKVAVMVEKVGL